MSAGAELVEGSRPPTFRYGEAELAHLRRRDRTLERAIDRIGMIERGAIPDLFTALLHAVVCQQVSLQADPAIWTMMREQIGPISEELRRCRLSARKTEHLRSIAGAMLRGSRISRRSAGFRTRR